MNRDEMYLSLGVSDKVLQFGEAVLDELKPRFAEIEEIAELNQAKVIGAMQKNSRYQCFRQGNCNSFQRTGCSRG